MDDPQHANEMMKMLTRLLRKSSKIVRATLRGPDVRVGGSNKTGRTLKIMCYDTTSWVKEVSAFLSTTCEDCR